MDFTLFLSMFGLEPSQFEDAVAGPEETESGWTVAVVQKPGDRRCPSCGTSSSVVIKDRYVRKIRHTMPDGRSGLILVERPRLFCRKCSKCFFPELEGLSPRRSMTAMELASLRRDLASMMTFAEVARRHGISPSTAVRLFDGMFPRVPGRPLPTVLCIDEVLFVVSG